MMPANDLILICPFCKGEKPIMQLMSGNTFGGSLRSDLKADYPMLPKPSPIQRCPHCGKYYFAYSAENKESTEMTFDKGELSYQEVTEALQQLSQEQLSNDEEITLRLLFVHNYNSTYQLLSENDQPTPTQEEQTLFRQQIERLLLIFELRDIEKAELHREIGLFDECLRLLDSAEIEDPFRDDVARRILGLAMEKSTKVFMISNQ